MTGAWIGREIGQYRITRLIGEGGMGSVYEAEHAQIGGRYAIKFLRSEVSLDSVVRFRNEARASATLHHPGIVQIFDFGRLDDGSFYLVMEFLHGQSLGARIHRDGRIAPDLLVDIARQMASALGRAHEVGIVHRDLKPENVFLVPDEAVPSGIRAKILDFGIAKLPSGVDTRSTQAGTILGTPAYMSPEQCQGLQEIDGRSDIYSFGCMLFEMATGRHPFADDSVLGLLRAHVELPTPSMLGFDSTLPATLDAIVQRATAKRPEDRYQTMAELSAELDRVWGSAQPRVSPPTLTPMMGAPPAPRTMVSTDVAAGADSPGPTVIGEPDDWSEAVHQLRRVLSESDAQIAATFLKGLFDGVEPQSNGLLELYDIQIPVDSPLRFFCIGVRETIAAGPQEIGTTTFAGQALGLEQYLSKLDSDEKKVAIVLTSGAGLSPGVRRKIREYRARFNTIVLPISIAEIRAALRRARLQQFFRERIQDLHSPTDPFADSGPARDPLRFIGMQQELDQVSVELQQPGRAIVIFGRPGCGKSSLVNMAELEHSTEFIRVRCSSVADGTVDGLVRHIVEKLGQKFGGASTLVNAPRPPEQENLRRTLYMAVPQTASPRTDTVLLLEDADCLVHPLVTTEDAESKKAQELWASVAKWCDEKRLRVIISGVRSYLLREKTLARWENPLATHVRLVSIAPFRRDICDRYVVEAALAANIDFSDEALREVYAQSAGVVDVARMLCSRAFSIAKHSTSAGELNALPVTEEHVREAADQLASSNELFHNTKIVLQQDEQIVLEQVAIRRPKVGQLKRLLATQVKPERVGEALDTLVKLGLVDYTRRNVHVRVPLLEQWLVRNATPIDIIEPRDYRGMILGGALTGAFVVTWLFLAARPHVREKPAQAQKCNVEVFYDESATPGEDMSIDVQCTCEQPDKPLRLVSVNHVATIGEPGKSEGRQIRESKPIPCEVDAPTIALAVSPGTIVEGDRSFKFSLRRSEVAVVDFEVQNDWWESAKIRAKKAVSLIAGLPVLIGGLVTFSHELRGALGKFGQVFGITRRRREEEEAKAKEAA